VRLADHLSPEQVLIAPGVRGRDDLFALFGDLLEGAGLVPSRDQVVARLLEREAILSTGIGGGVAVPHAQLENLGRLVMAASVHPRGLDYPALDDEPVKLVFCLLGDSGTAADHLAGLARLARLARRIEARQALVAASTPSEFLATLARLEDS
jgi:mannitol/fructose-specific phosphotransferase system IIA component (Ntr-type)